MSDADEHRPLGREKEGAFPAAECVFRMKKGLTPARRNAAPWASQAAVPDPSPSDF